MQIVKTGLDIDQIIGDWVESGILGRLNEFPKTPLHEREVDGFN